ncbi:MAG: nucleotidyltransferase family protein [Oscillospiraceae bacterium]|nr:nucleotidyltransferase family protein [Oscillospiraceae bacterium]
MGAYMRIGAVIAEFNPFHNGHAYIVSGIKEENDVCAAVMSGNFVQRGEPAIYDKFTRARAAVYGGVDLVLELPVEYAVNNAETFAYGGVYILDACGCVDSLYFGSECGNLDKIESAAELMLDEPPAVSRKIRELLDKGYGYSAAREAAYGGMTDADIISKPNNILAVEYVKALKRMGSGIVPDTIKRINTEHDGMTVCGGYASASLIRDMIVSGKNADEFMPHKCAGLFKNAPVCRPDSADDIILYLLRRYGAGYISEINDVSEGIENRIYKAACTENGIDGIVNRVCTKRYSRARIRRIIISAILGIKKNDIKIPSYIRVLAMNKKGAAALSVMKRTARIPIITKAADFKEMLGQESRVSDIYSALNKTEAGGEYTSSVFVDV